MAFMVADGRVIVSGEWLLKHQGQLIKRPFNIVLRQEQDGYDAMVKTLAQAWSRGGCHCQRAIVCHK